MISKTHFWLAALTSLASASVCATTGPVQTGIFARADNAVDANLNPAGLTRIKQREVVGQLLYFNSTSDFEYQSDQQPGTFTDDNGGSTFVPFIYFAQPLTDKIGAGIFVSGNAVDQDFNDSGPASYLITEWDLVTATLQGNIAYKLTDKLSLGGGVNANYTSFEYKANVLNLEPDSADGSMKLDESDISFGYQLGLLYEFTPQTRVGLTYRSEIDPSLSDSPQYSNIGPGRQALFDAGLGVFNQNIGLDIRIPQAVLGGIYHEFQNGDGVELDAGWVDASQFGFTDISLGDDQITPRSNGLRDIWVASLGYFHQLDEKWQLSVGGLYVSSAVSDANRTYGFKVDSLWGAGVGAEYKYTKNMVFGLNLNFYGLGSADTQATIEQTGDTISGKYDDHYALGLDFTVRWINPS